MELPHPEKKQTISSPPRIVSIATGFGSVLWTFIMPMVMIFILRQDRNYAGHFSHCVPNTWKSFKLPQAIDVFFLFFDYLTFEFLMFNRRTQPSSRSQEIELAFYFYSFGIAQPCNLFVAPSFWQCFFLKIFIL